MQIQLQSETTGLMLMSLGGIAYLSGLLFYSADGRIPFAHAIWHLFVMAGTFNRRTLELRRACIVYSVSESNCAGVLLHYMAVHQHLLDKSAILPLDTIKMHDASEL